MTILFAVAGRESDNPPEASRTRGEAAEFVRDNCTAIRLKFTWFGKTRSLTDEQLSEAAETFGAESEALSASKKILGRHKTITALDRVKRDITDYFKSVSLPYPENGVRLIRRDLLDEFEQKVQSFQRKLYDATSALTKALPEIKVERRVALGNLFDEANYPATFFGMFGVTWNVENVSPPDYLMELKPELYERELSRCRGLLEQAVAKAEEAFITEFSELVESLEDKLNGEADGKPKVVKDLYIENLRDFIDKFGKLNVRSNGQLTKLVTEADALLDGVSGKMMRKRPELRGVIGGRLKGVKDQLDSMLVDQPRRNVFRKKTEPVETPDAEPALA